MAIRASGTFEVKIGALPAVDVGDGAVLGRSSITKRFVGDLEGTSLGEMLSTGTPVQGSAGYVAIERVVGTLQGKSGSFVLQHSGTLDRGAPTLLVAVVPDSGTGDLSGLSGRMAILRADGKHSYEFDYTLPEVL